MRLLPIFCGVVLLSTASVAQAPPLDAVTAAQIRLDRAGFSPGEIDGRMGANTRRAIAALQAAHQLPSSGQPDNATRQALASRAGSPEPLTRYTITADDVDGPFTHEIPADMMEKAKLEALGYRTPLEALAERFHVSPALFWDADPTHARARIAPGPNNPVGTIWIDLTKEHYGLHGTPEPGRIGHSESHGCVRLTNWDIQRVARFAAPGTPVIFR
jgi:hypothetical protein